jgi:predicted DNA-binding ribbon-helix-helix protein
MAERYYRAQILLEPEQHDHLREIAEREDRSISDVAREMIKRGLRAREEDRQSRLQQARKALEQLDQIRRQVAAKHGVYHGNLVAEVRSEREKALDEIWQGRS